MSDKNNGEEEFHSEYFMKQRLAVSIAKAIVSDEAEEEGDESEKNKIKNFNFNSSVHHHSIKI